MTTRCSLRTRRRSAATRSLRAFLPSGADVSPPRYAGVPHIGCEFVDFYAGLSSRIVIGGLATLLSIALFVFLAGALGGILTEPLAQALFDISYVLGSYAGGIGFGVTLLAIVAVALRSGALLPRWLAMSALAIGLAMVTPLAGYVLGEYTVAPCFLLVAVLGVLLLRGSALRPGRHSEHVAEGPAGRPFEL